MRLRAGTPIRSLAARRRFEKEKQVMLPWPFPRWQRVRVSRKMAFIIGGEMLFMKFYCSFLSIEAPSPRNC
jgi:hypothetical protein